MKLELQIYIKRSQIDTVESLNRKTSIVCRIAGKQLNVQFHVMPYLPHDFLLGMDKLNKLNIKVFLNDLELSQTKLHTGNEICVAGVREFLKVQKQKINKFVEEEKLSFDNIHGPTPNATYEIKTLKNIPIKQRYRPRNPLMQKIIDAEVEKMTKQGVIEPSTSAWSSPIVLAKKKQGEYRFCIDFKKINEVSEIDAYPLPQIEAILNKLREAKYISTIDLKNGYWQVPLAENSKQYTAFTVLGRGLMQFTVMPFGLHSAPAVFQRLMDSIITPELKPNVFCYLDDIVIISETYKKHRSLLQEVFRRLKAAKLKPN
ncbi:hypothetical protein TKK_0002885 [Trichogramma kaykai]|uniref:Reverse transcriptase domain-containing protein n=1 Tax=Trichogramma kaykai TaxID=54128 RepID=A0ABD2XQ83_9HYME